MPTLDEISYSREACIAAVRDYYEFLSKLYLETSEIMVPPEGGWPSVTQENLGPLFKTDAVIDLLRHLPYPNTSGAREIQCATSCKFANWAEDAHSMSTHRTDAEDLLICSEGASNFEYVPSHVIGLTRGGRYNEVFLLDTQLGVVYWCECPGEIRRNSTRAEISDDPYEYADEAEAEWRAEAGTWAIADFFQMLKDQFRELNFIPINSEKIIDVYPSGGDNKIQLVLQDIYRQHSWPDLEKYRKEECLAAVRAAWEEYDLNGV